MCKLLRLVSWFLGFFFCLNFELIVLGLDSSNTSLGISENGIALSITSTSTKTNSQPDGEGSSSEKENRGNDAKAKTKRGLD